MLDLIIIGMGIGGITSAIYAKRSNLDVLVLDKGMPGGLLNSIHEIENYPGIPNIKGIDFAKTLFEQVNSMNISYKMEEVLEITTESDIKIVKTRNGEYKAKNVIIATGRKPKYLGLNNEADYIGRGISTCASCDGNFYKDKDIAVVGAGNSALQEALSLTRIVNKVYLLNRKDTFNKAEASLVEKVKQNDKIEIIYKVNIKDINETDGKISSVTLDNDETINVEGIFIFIGFVPNIDIVKNLNITDESGYILVDEKMETKIKGIYAVGDVIKKDYYQLVTATNDGALAVHSIITNND